MNDTIFGLLVAFWLVDFTVGYVVTYRAVMEMLMQSKKDRS
jgi:hypothetical protein